MRSILLLYIPFIVFATGQTLTPREHMSIHSYNNRPVVKSQTKTKMHRLHKIDEQEAARITKEATSEESQSVELIHSGMYLMFKVRTANYLVSINALDGTIIKKEKK